MSISPARMQFRESFASWPDRLVAGAIAGMAVLAWWALWTRPAYAHGAPYLAQPSLRSQAALVILGWNLMTIAMMLPASAPLLILFHRMIYERARAIWLIGLVVAGYLLVWSFCGAILELAAGLIYKRAARLVLPAAAAWISGAVLLAAAGLYQFSSLKSACLDQCRSPLTFLASRWHGDNESMEALRIGVDHGIFCVGCCWSLMLLMFVTGLGSLSVMLILGVVMGLERNFSWGRRLSAPVGGLLLAVAALLFVAGIRPSVIAFAPSIDRGWCGIRRPDTN
jgi:predicted metal-binding membrane protein